MLRDNPLYKALPIGALLTDPNEWAKEYTYTADGSLASVEINDGVHTWRKTYSYTAGKLMRVSGWEKQP